MDRKTHQEAAKFIYYIDRTKNSVQKKIQYILYSIATGLKISI